MNASKMRGQALDAIPALLAELKACSSSRNLQRGRTVHESAVLSGCDSDVWVANTLINMYAKCGSLVEARKVFDTLKTRTVVSWNALLLGYVDNGDEGTVLDLFLRMSCEEAPDERTFVIVLKACSRFAAKEKFKLRSRERGTALNLLASRCGCDSDLYVQSILVDMYAKCESMDQARRIFESMLRRNEVSWNALVMGYAENGEGNVALQLFSRMALEGCKPQERAYVAALKACTDLAERASENGHLTKELGEAVHILASRSGHDSYIYVENSLVDMYAKLASLKDARRVFERMVQKNVVSWTALILGYADTGEAALALDIFCRMRREGCAPDSRTFVAALKACTDLVETEPEKGEIVHLLASSAGCDSELFVGNTMVDMYAKSGRTDHCRRVFDSMRYRDVVSWTVLILGYADNGEAEMALGMFSRMEQIGFPPDTRSFVAALKACINITSTERGEAVHLLASTKGCDSDIYVQSSLIDMYAKCGWMKEACSVFETVKHPDVVCWNALLMGYADNGEEELVMRLFSRMKREGHKPDAFTFSAVLKSCALLGALGSGKAVHDEICRLGLDTYRVLATYLVSFYVRCGSLAEAEQVFEEVFDPLASKDVVLWNALLAGFSRHGDTEGVFSFFERMQRCEVHPDGATLLIVLTACNHAGLIDEGKKYFEGISTKYGIKPSTEHYTCMVDILGRANQLDEAMFLLRGVPCSPADITWTAVLGACGKWQRVELGRLAFESLMKLDCRYVEACVLMTNAYRTST